MWFAALGNYRQNPWFVNFCERLLQGSPEVLALMEKNPFPDHPPRYIRAEFYDYNLPISPNAARPAHGGSANSSVNTCRRFRFMNKIAQRIHEQTTENRAFNWFTPLRFGILLALLIFAAFPQVILGLQTFVARDYGFFSYPLAHFQRDCFWRGEMPFWNPYNYCGVPFLAQWNTMPLYPPSLIYLVLPLEWSLSFFCLLHLWFAGLGMYFLARRWTGNNFAAAFAGTVFSFNGFTLNLLMWPSHMATFAWMPWVVLAVELAWREGGRKIFLAAFAGAMQMLAGGPETIFLTWIFLLALWLQQFVNRRIAAQKNVLAVSAASSRWSFALAAAQLLPFLDLVAHSQRETGYADLRWSMPGSGWANFLVPMAFGGTWTRGVFFQYGQYWTSSYYLGIGALWLALLASWKAARPPRLAARRDGVAALIFALGENTPVLPDHPKNHPAIELHHLSGQICFARRFCRAVARGVCAGESAKPEKTSCDRRHNFILC